MLNLKEFGSDYDLFQGVILGFTYGAEKFHKKSQDMRCLG
jgi:hypothetical protein